MQVVYLDVASFTLLTVLLDNSTPGILDARDVAADLLMRDNPMALSLLKTLARTTKVAELNRALALGQIQDEEVPESESAVVIAPETAKSTTEHAIRSSVVEVTSRGRFKRIKLNSVHSIGHIVRSV